MQVRGSEGCGNAFEGVRLDLARPEYVTYYAIAYTGGSLQRGPSLPGRSRLGDDQREWGERDGQRGESDTERRTVEGNARLRIFSLYAAAEVQQAKVVGKASRSCTSNGN